MGTNDAAANSSSLSQKRAARVDEKAVVVDCKLDASMTEDLKIKKNI